MQQQAKGLRVILTSDGFYPQALRWQGRAVRVLYVEKVQTAGLERRYRVRTGEGPYELGCHIATGAWQIHRGPNWLDRARARLARMPRYPLPAWRRRSHPAIKTAQAKSAPVAGGGNYANRLALVR